MPFLSVPWQNCNVTVQCCKSLTYLTPLIKLRFLCLVCQMCHIIAFSTNTTSAVDALTQASIEEKNNNYKRTYKILPLKVKYFFNF